MEHFWGHNYLAVVELRGLLHKENKMEKIQKFKTETIVIKEAKENIVSCINAQGVNVAVLEMILKELYNEVAVLAQQQYEKDKQAYEADFKDDKRAEMHGDIVNGYCE